jgi:hypothetical protein
MIDKNFAFDFFRFFSLLHLLKKQLKKHLLKKNQPQKKKKKRKNKFID